jgi:LmbE family N-acetylglucosaminyl deacetylase
MVSHKTLVVAPHPDDELLGCGGTLLRRKAEGAELCWLIVTAMREDAGWPAERVREREVEIRRVATAIGFDQVVNLRFIPAQLDAMPLAQVVAEFSKVFAEFSPTEVFVPHRGDVHSDHRVVFDAAAACCKWFRYPSVHRVLAYETLSETDFGLARGEAFVPNVFVDISDCLERKLEFLSIYHSELSIPPFPRSVETVRAQAQLRGAAAGYLAAEAFELLRERL